MADLPQPQIRPRAAYSFNRSTTAAPPGLQGSAQRGSTGGAVLNGTTYSEVVCVASNGLVRVRLLTVGAIGTLTVTPLRPIGANQPADAVVGGDGYINPTKVTKYATGGVSKAVAAATECVVDVGLSGENWVLVEFVCTGNGTITYCDVMQNEETPILGGVDGTGNSQAFSFDSNGGDNRSFAARLGLITNAIGYAYNNVGFDRLRSAGAAILSAFSSLGALLVHLPGDWSQAHTPAAATQATTTKAAGAAGVRHVCTSITAVLATVGTLQGPIQINVRDGATGAGTILWSVTIQLPVNGIAIVQLTGLNIVGSAATAMTLETSAAPVAAATASVSMTGHEAA